MKRLFKRRLSLLLVLAVMFGILTMMPSCKQTGIFEQKRDYITGEWKLSRVPDTKAEGTELSQKGFDYEGDKDWIKATVPGTVLTSYLNEGLVPQNIYYGSTLQELEDKTDAQGNSYYNVDYWYTTQFEVDKSAGDTVWLNFDGINYEADVFVNGNEVGTVTGAFIRGRFDVTDYVKNGKNNYLAVYIHWCNSAVKDMPSFLVSEGWDFSPKIPGRNMGIYKDVYLTYTEDVSIVDPYVKTNLPLPDLTSAKIDISTELLNNTNRNISGTLKGVIYPQGGDMSQAITFEKDVKVNKPTEEEEMTLVTFDTIVIENPKLWWPNGAGEQNMYCLQLSFDTAFGTSDVNTVDFGIREFSYDYTETTDLVVSCNGQKIMMRGGNWGSPEAMLNFTDKDMDTAIRYEAEQGFNCVRFWHGAADFESVYDACDKYGLVVFDDFWLNGSEMPKDVKAFYANVQDKIRRLRNHPSIAVWIGENEATPPGSLATLIPKAINELDGVRFYAPSSNTESLTGGVTYSIHEPAWYFEQGKITEGFTTEYGCVSVPTVETMRLMMSEESLWPIFSADWLFHDFDEDIGNKLPGLYVDAVNQRYGMATNIDEFCEKAQLLNIETWKAIFESWNDYMWENCSGIQIWMSHPTWPTNIWQTYDYYYDQNGAYFGAKAACEQIHVQMNASTGSVKVINMTTSELANVTVRADIYNLDGTCAYTESVSLNAIANGYTEAMNLFTGGAKLRNNASVSNVHFVKLYLLDETGSVLSENIYWRNKNGNNYNDLNKMAEATLGASATMEKGETTTKITLNLQNQSSGIALAVRIKAIRDNAAEGEDNRILPCYYNDNYVTLLGNESKTVTIEFDNEELMGGNCQLVIEGYNTAQSIVAVQ